MSDREEAKDAVGGDVGKDDKETVQFRHLAEHENASFKVSLRDTLQAIWDKSYTELDVARGERDVLQAPGDHDNPVSLMEHMTLSLGSAQRQGLCKRKFEIAARTGGA